MLGFCCTTWLLITLGFNAFPVAGSHTNGEAKPVRTSFKFAPTPAQANKSRVVAARKRRTGDIRKLFAEAKLDYPPAQALLRVFKNEDVQELWVRPVGQKRFVHLKDYAICARSGQLGPKRKRGDLQVPEGFYTVTHYNANSHYLLSMLINYPNRSDRIRRQGLDAGGSICIHGDCVTIGCVPLTDRWIEELYLICLDTTYSSSNPTLVHIFPGRLTEPAWSQLRNQYQKQPLLIDFWKELKAGHDQFEQDHIPNTFWIDQQGAYRFE